MKDQKNTEQSKTALSRQQQNDALLEEAMERPGIREVMRVYGDWKNCDRALETYRKTARRGGTSSNHSIIPGLELGCNYPITQISTLSSLDSARFITTISNGYT